MEQDLENIMLAGGNDGDIEAAILINILGEEEITMRNDNHQFMLDELKADECKFLFRFQKEKDAIYLH